MSDIKVTFKQSDETISWDNDYESLAEFAEDNSIDLDLGCRFGDCGTCMTTLCSGKVSYENEPATTPDEGTCLPCCCVPTEPIELDL